MMPKCFWCTREAEDHIIIQIDLGLTLYCCQGHMKLAVADLRKDLDLFIRFGVMAVFLTQNEEAARQ